MNVLPGGLYGVADAGFGDPVALGIALAEAGVQVIQLRAKGWSTSDRTAAAAALLHPLHARGSLLIINDDLDAACAAGADGLHLGQADGPLQAARRALGPRALLGRSTHTLAEVDAAGRDADYIGFGPVFATTTHPDPYAVRGLELLAAAVAHSTVPVVAIGGINFTNISDVRESGAHAWAVISALLRAPDLAGAAAALGASR